MRSPLSRRALSRRRAVAAGILTAALAVTACSSGSSSSSSAPASSSAAGSGKVVHLTITDWDNGMPAVVSAWNQSHPDIQVRLIKPAGTGYTLYNKLITDNRAGTNPDISEIEYQALPEAGANWWTASGNTWNVAINDTATQKVASYWQGLVNAGTISPEPSWSTQWLTDMNKGNLVGWASAQWAPNQFPTIAPSTSGQWVAAALPAWTAGDKTVGTWGGEAEVVTSSSKYPQQAAEFISWMNSSQEGLNLLIKNVDVFPAATFAQSSPALQTPPPFMSDQPSYNSLMASVAQGVRGFQIWGPDASVTFSSYSDAFASALQNHTAFSAALDKVQNTTVSDMKNAGFQVTG